MSRYGEKYKCGTCRYFNAMSGGLPNAGKCFKDKKPAPVTAERPGCKGYEPDLPESNPYAELFKD